MVSFLLFVGIVSCCLTIFYWWMMAKYRRSWNDLPNWYIPPDYYPTVFISIIIPARNEDENIEACLNSILSQNYPKNLFEIIVIDDHSTDNTSRLVQSFSTSQVQLINLANAIQNKKLNAFKKAAIQIGVSKAKGSLIVTTDADCITPSNWLRLIASFHEIKKYQFIAGPVQFHNEATHFERFQSLDFLGMMLITGAGIQSGWVHMCNGANLAYTKTLFKEANGFLGVDHLASGDDMFLMQKVAAKHPEYIGFLKNKDASTYTFTKKTIKSFLRQRVRWASKSGSYQQKRMTIILGLVLLFCSSIIANIIIIILTGSKLLLILLFLQLIIKSVADFLLLKEASRYFNRPELMKVFWRAEWLHLIYIVFVGFAANFYSNYEWKGRKVK